MSEFFRLLFLRFIQEVIHGLAKAGQDPTNLIERVRLVPSTVVRQNPRDTFCLIFRRGGFKGFRKNFREFFSVQIVIQVLTQKLR